MKFCTKCGSNVEGMDYCGECGNKVENSTGSASPDISGSAYNGIVTINGVEINLYDIIRVYGKHKIGAASKLMTIAHIKAKDANQYMDEAYKNFGPLDELTLAKRTATQTKQILAKSTSQKKQHAKSENSTKYKKPLFKRKWFIAVCIVLLLGAVGSFFDSDESKPTKDNENSDATTEKKLSKSEQFAVDNQISEKLAKTILSVSSDIGIPSKDIYSFEKIEDWANGERYTYGYNDTKFTVYINKYGSINSINSGTIKFYEDGSVIYKAKDRILSTEEKALVLSYSKDAVLANLKSPATAEFPGTILESDQWVVNKNKKTYKVSSYVDAQNSFGAMIRSNVLVEFSWNGDLDIAPTIVDVQIE